MSLFINIETLEYPRHIGDVELNPLAQWAEVIRTEPIGELQDGFEWIEDVPEIEDSEWKQRWKQSKKRDMTLEEIEIEKARIESLNFIAVEETPNE